MIDLVLLLSLASLASHSCGTHSTMLEAISCYASTNEP